VRGERDETLLPGGGLELRSRLEPRILPPVREAVRRGPSRHRDLHEVARPDRGGSPDRELRPGLSAEDPPTAVGDDLDLHVVLADAAEALLDQGAELLLGNGDPGADSQDHGRGVYERGPTEPT
jgi:hypothetical protein